MALAAANVLLDLRHHEKALLEGEYIPLDENNPQRAFLPRYKNEALLVGVEYVGPQHKTSDWI